MLVGEVAPTTILSSAGTGHSRRRDFVGLIETCALRQTSVPTASAKLTSGRTLFVPAGADSDEVGHRFRFISDTVSD